MKKPKPSVYIDPNGLYYGEVMGEVIKVETDRSGSRFQVLFLNFIGDGHHIYSFPVLKGCVPVIGAKFCLMLSERTEKNKR